MRLSWGDTATAAFKLRRFRCGDFGVDSGILMIPQIKFGKLRHVPLQLTTALLAGALDLRRPRQYLEHSARPKRAGGRRGLGCIAQPLAEIVGPIDTHIQRNHVQLALNILPR